MKTLRLLSVFTLGFVALAPFARSADATTPPPAETREHRAHEFRERRMHRLDEKLHLTADQKTKIEAIWDAAEKQSHEQQGEQAADDRREHRRAMMRETHAQVRAVLTPDQQKIFDEMRPERGHHGGEGQHGGDKDGDAK